MPFCPLVFYDMYLLLFIQTYEVYEMWKSLYKITYSESAILGRQ